MARPEYIQFLVRQANIGLNQQSIHDQMEGQLHVVTRDVLREKMIREKIDKEGLKGADIVDILPLILRC
ncbi:hypothetical protein A2W13_00270 [Candidatus Woesebacteria bacterium RBG_16_36_11]|uniref:Uncharacterized protein n=1 Tax=Candidatus Woesebacteria bacterium RBG_16_36_11 TaxID=1802481 RepID=A0A1F7X7J3_9BACT|nr:MAG: hypothetical protein A2W13_00270 [Candidatus Woesebacteria bacterium RBG_16_36_11]